MTDINKKEGVTTNWAPKNAIVVTNGEGEWEHEAKACTSLIVCPEASDIPGKTVLAILDQMPLCKRVVLVTPAGTKRGMTIEEKEDNWIFNRMMILGGKRVGSAADNIPYALSCEEAVEGKLSDGAIDRAVIIHRGVLKGGGGGDGIGERYYKVCGSEPEEIVERTYDKARKGCIIIPGDGIDLKKKNVIKGSGPDVLEGNLREEIKNKTNRLGLSAAIVASLTMDDPMSRFSVVCDLKEERDGVEEVKEMIKRAKVNA